MELAALEFQMQDAILSVHMHVAKQKLLVRHFLLDFRYTPRTKT